MKKEENTECGLIPQEAKSVLNINGLEYSYSISKLDKAEGIKIKLFESNPGTNIYYEYEGTSSELTKSIKVLMICEDLDKMISTIKTTFDEGRTKFIEDNNKYYLELQFEEIGKSKVYKIEFIKYDPKDSLTELNNIINTVQNDIKICENLNDLPNSIFFTYDKEKEEKYINSI